MSEESTLSLRGLCRYIHRLSKASKAGMKAALADCPKCHFPMLEGLAHTISTRGQDGAVYVSDFARETHQPLPAISRGLRQLEQDGVAKVVRPRRPIEMGRLERDPAVLQRVYDQGYAVGQKTEL